MNKKELMRWQSEVNRIVGVEPDGTWRIRFVWGGDLQKTLIWDRYARAWYPRYWSQRRLSAESEEAKKEGRKIAQVAYEYLGHVPRIFVEALVYAPSDESVLRGGVDFDGSRFTARPTGPQYVTCFPICQHSMVVLENEWKQCCWEIHERDPKLKCFGEYRPIDQMDIDYIREEFEKRQHHWAPKPGERITKADQTRLFKEELGWWRAQRLKAQPEIERLKRETIDDLIRQKHGPTAYFLPDK